RRRLDLVQYAVVAVANAQPVLERFDVHVGSTRFNGPGDQLIDQADDGSFAGKVLETVGVFLGRFAPGDHFLQERIALAILKFRIKAIERRFEFDRNSDGDGNG